MSVQKGSRHKKYSDSKAPGIQPFISENYKSSLTPPTIAYTKSLFYVGSSLNRENNLLLIYAIDKHRSTFYSHFRGLLLLFTLEGYLVTRYLCRIVLHDHSAVSVHFTSDNILFLPTEYFPHCLIFHYTDYSSGVNNIEGILFACHKNGDIYNTGKQQNSISVYSSDFQLKRNFQLASSDPMPGFILALMIEGDELVVLVKCCDKLPWKPNFERPTVTPECELYRYCLKTGDLLQLGVLANRVSYRHITNVCCTDRFTNVLLDCDKSSGYCVWSTDGRIRYFQLKARNYLRKWSNKTIGYSLTDNFQLICVMYSGIFKVHNII